MKTENLNMILDCGVVPVVRARSLEQALNIVEAIKSGGINIVEITMTIPGAIEVMKEIAGRFGDEILLGAGTVLDAETARTAILAGAEFIVGPNLNEDVIQICKRYSKIVMPGALTPTEVVRAWERGADLVKIFPVNQVGGPKYIKALRGPLPHISFVPTGGVDLENTEEYIKAGAFAVAVGTSLIDKKAVAEGQFNILSEKAKQFIIEVKKARA